jgi:hypothetical protein
MKLTRKLQKVYLSGPMTGIPEFNRPAFDEAAAYLRDRRFEVYVPGENETYDEQEVVSLTTTRAKRHFYLSRDIDLIQEWADSVVVLPDWEFSEGAKLEVLVAQSIGVPVYEFVSGKVLERVVFTGVSGEL